MSTHRTPNQSSRRDNPPSESTGQSSSGRIETEEQKFAIKKLRKMKSQGSRFGNVQLQALKQPVDKYGDHRVKPLSRQPQLSKVGGIPKECYLEREREQDSMPKQSENLEKHQETRNNQVEEHDGEEEDGEDEYEDTDSEIEHVEPQYDDTEEEEEENEQPQGEEQNVVADEDEESVSLLVSLSENLISCEVTSSTGFTRKTTFISTIFGCRVDVSGDDERFVEEFDTTRMAVAFLKEIVERNPRKKFQKMEFDLLLISHRTDKVFAARRTRFLEELNSAWGSLEQRVAVQELKIWIDNSEQDLLSVLPHLEPGVLETISVSTAHNEGRNLWLPLDDVVQLEQWKQAKVFQSHVGDNIVYMPFENWKHFKNTVIGIEHLTEKLVQDVIKNMMSNSSIKEVSISFITSETINCFGYNQQLPFQSRIDMDFNKYLLIHLTQNTFQVWSY